MENDERREGAPDQEPVGDEEPIAAGDRADATQGEPMAAADPTGDPPEEESGSHVQWRNVTKTLAFRAAVLAAALSGVVLLLVGGVVNRAGTFLFPNEPASSDGTERVIVSSPKPEPPKGEPMRVVDVRPVPRRDGDASWLYPAPVGDSALERFQPESPGFDVYRSEEADTTMRRAGAIPATVSTVELELEGNRERVVRIVRVEAEIVNCRQPVDGTVFYAPPQGAVNVVGLGFDLDSPDPYAQEVKPRDGGPPLFTGDYFAKKKYTLKRYEQVTFRFTARTFEQDCSFRYRFDLTVNGKPTEQIIDNDGEPFRVSGLIQQGGDRRAPVDCGAYERFYVARYMVQGDVGQLAPWVTGEGRAECG